MKNVLKKGIAFTLALTLSVSSANVSLFITKADQQAEEKSNVENSNFTVNSETVKPKVVEEVMSDRTTDSTTFLLSNGMKQTTYYSDDIYFENEKGQLSEYDNEFVKLDKSDKKQVTDSVEVKGTEKEKYSYVNKEGDSKQFLPSRLSEKTPIVMAKENCIVSFSPADVEDEDSEENILSSETEKVKLDSKSVTSVYDGSREEKKVIAGYEGENKATELSYESLEHGLKENIILKNKPKSNVVSFNMTLQGCYAKVDETGGGITLYSEDDDIVGGMEAPFMDDATENNYSEEIHYELTEINEKEDENDCEPFTPRTIYPHHKERISDLKSEQKSLLDEQKKVEEELKDVDYRLTQISDIIKIVEQSESTDQVSILKDTYDMIISELNHAVQSIDKCMRFMDEEKSSSNMQCKKEMKSALDCLYNVIGLL